MNLNDASKYIHLNPSDMMNVRGFLVSKFSESNDWDLIESKIKSEFSGDLLEYALELFDSNFKTIEESVETISEEKSSYMGVEIVFNGKSFSAPSLAIYNVPTKPQIKLKIKEKILKRNETQNKLGSKNSVKKEALEILDNAIAEAFFDSIEEDFEDPIDSLVEQYQMNRINDLHVYSLENELVESSEEFFEILDEMSEDEFSEVYSLIEKKVEDEDNTSCTTKRGVKMSGKRKGNVIIHPSINSKPGVYESTEKSPDVGPSITTCDNREEPKKSKRGLFRGSKLKKEETEMSNLELSYDDIAEIATDYFMEQGLNDDGIDILIEDLGVEEFCDYVDEIVEAELTEWRRGADGSKVRGSGMSKSGKNIFALKGGAKSAAIRATPEHKARKAEREREPSGSSKMKDALRSQSSVVAKAKASQASPKPTSTPTQTKEKAKGGILGAIKSRAERDGAAFNRSRDTARTVAVRRAAEVKAAYDAIRSRGKAVEKHPEVVRARRKHVVAVGRAAQSAERAIGRTAVKAGGAAGAALGSAVAARRSGASAAATAGRALGTFIRKMRKEDYDFLADLLMNSSYELSEDQAYDILESMDEEDLILCLENIEISEATRYAKETGYKYSPATNVRRRPYVKGGTWNRDETTAKVREYMKSRPEGKAVLDKNSSTRGVRKVKGKKPPAAGERGAERSSPEQIVQARRWLRKQNAERLRRSGTLSSYMNV